MNLELFKIFEKKPKDFVSDLAATGCFIECQGEVLLLQQSSEKQDAGCWGIPGGKLEAFETLYEGLLRELKEETAISIKDHTLIEHFSTLYVRKPFVDFAFHLFALQLHSRPEVILSFEHSAYKWVSLDEARDMSMRVGGQLVLQKYRDYISYEKSTNSRLNLT